MKTLLTPIKALLILLAGLATLAALVFGLWIIWVIYFLTNATSIPNSFDLNQSSSYEFVGAFARSLAFNHTEDIRAHLDPTKWDLISRWETEHIAFAASPADCSYPDVDITPTMLSAGNDEEDNVTYILPLLCNRKTIFFTVSGLHLKLQSGKWMIMDLASVCQELGDGNKEQCWK